MRKPKTDALPAINCPDCGGRSQYRRHLHWLQFATSDDLRAHLQTYMADAFTSSDGKPNGGLDAVLAWRGTMYRLYSGSGMVRDDGTNMPTWEVWKNAH